MQVTQEELKRYEELQLLALDFARQGQTSELKAMLEAKMPINLCDHKGNSLLMLAAYHGNEETTLMLLQMGACVDQKNDRGQTPLAGVCFKGYFNIVKLLVQAGANIHENNGLGTTPLFFASMFGHKQIVQYLNQQAQHQTFKNRILLALSSLVHLFRKKPHHP